MYLCHGEGCTSQSLDSISERWREGSMSLVSMKGSTVLTQNKQNKSLWENSEPFTPENWNDDNTLQM